MSDTAAEPTAAAQRAVAALDIGCNPIAQARIIDATTHLPELIAACEALVAAVGDCGYDCRQRDVDDAEKLARAALAAASIKPEGT